MSINRSGETTVELATLHKFKCFRQFYVFTVRSSVQVQIHNKNNMINSKITWLQVTYKYKICNQFSLNATYAKLSGKWNVVRKWSWVTVSQLI